MVRKSKKDSKNAHFSVLKSLKKILHKEEKSYQPHKDEPLERTVDGNMSDEELFAQEMNGIQPLQSNEDPPLSPQPQSEREVPFFAEAEKEKPHPRFRFRKDGGTIEGALVDLGPQVLRKLKRGRFPIEAQLDLHGLNKREARSSLDSFVLDAAKTGLRCVLVVHGKGHNSENLTPVLKNEMHAWLCEGILAEVLLAYTSAQPSHGGTGAIYLLLRRQRED